MSLVVAMIDGARLHICADLRIVKPESRPENESKHSPNLFNGVMKVIPITENLAIAFAGTVEIALRVIRAVHASQASYDKIPIELLERLSDEGNQDECDFLVIDASRLKITRIRNGQIETIEQGRTWIGDPNAYSVFQAKIRERGYSDELNPIAKSSLMMNALQDVIDDDTIQNVGEYPFSMFNSAGQLQPAVSFSAQGPQNLQPGMNRMEFSNDPNADSLVINCLAPIDHGVAAMGIYLNRFQKGALYLPLLQDEPYIVEGRTIGEYRDRVLNEHGVELLGGGFE